MCFLPILILQNNEVSLHNFTVILKKGTVPVNNTNLPTAQVGVITTAKQYLCVTSNWVTKSGNLINRRISVGRLLDNHRNEGKL